VTVSPARGTLYLLPTPLGAGGLAAVMPPRTLEVLSRVRHFIAENPRNARAVLKAAAFPVPVQEAHIATLNEHTRASQLDALLQPALDGFDCAVLSEAGCPAVADPGAALVRLAHARGVKVTPLVGPSALLLGLMASGMNGQRFAFHGYLPIDADERGKSLVSLETASERERVTQMFIEAPYRNDALFDAIIGACRGDTLLCIASDLTLESEFIRTRTVEEWHSERPQLHRRPTVFLLYRERTSSTRRR
jgi:16S rRNA (cytidine1402-2'-O)-methyltransferase